MSENTKSNNPITLLASDYNEEMNPLFAKFIFASEGLSFPDFEGANALVIGYDKGLSLNLFSAASPFNWCGVNQQQDHREAIAQELLKAGTHNTQLHISSFADFAQLDNLPMFDFVCIHNIWSLISTEEQNALVQLLFKKIKINGVVYISYDTSPGSVPFEPFRQAVVEYDKLFNDPNASIEERLHKVVTYLVKLCEQNPEYLKQNPGLYKDIEAFIVRINNREYDDIIHEYFSDNWRYYHLEEVKAALDRAKLSYVCSAHLMDRIDKVNLTEAQSEFLNKYRAEPFYETARDFVLNIRKRCDLYTKGAISLTFEEKVKAFSNLAFVLKTPLSEALLSFSSRLGNVSLDPAVYDSIIEFFSDYKVHTIEELAKNIGGTVEFGLIEEIVVSLTLANIIAPAYNTVSDEAKQRCIAFNKTVLGKQDPNNNAFADKLNNINCNHLASPVLGGGIFIEPLNMKLISIYCSVTEKNEQAMFEQTKAFLQRITTENNEQLNDEQITQVVNNMLEKFFKYNLPVYKSLMLFED